MGTHFLIDTNVVIDFLRGTLPLAGDTFLRHIMEEKAHALSVVTRIELLSWQAPSSEELGIVAGFVETCPVFGLEENIIRETIRLRQHHKRKLPDSIIAATALVHQLTLLTRNGVDFKSIEGVLAIDPHVPPPLYGRS